MRLVEQSDEAQARKDYTEAIKALQQATQLVPEDMDLRYKLAMALMKADRLPEMFRVLRQAALKHPGHPEIANGLLSYWRMFDEQGLFNTTEKTSTVLRVLGKPDHVAKGPDRTRYVYGFMAIESRDGVENNHQTVDLRGLKPEDLKPSEFVEVSLDGRGWTVGHRTTNQNSTLAEYVLPGQKVQNWEELFSIQRLHDAAKLPVRQIAENMMNSLAQQVPTRQYRIVEEQPDSVLYEWKVPAANGTSAQHELARLIRGKRDVHRIAFVAKRTEISSELRDRWLKILKEAKLTPVGPSNVKTQTQTQMSTPKTAKADSQRALQMWRLGQHLSTAVFAHAQREEALAKEQLVLAFRITREFGVQMPPPFELTEAPATNVTRAIDYLLVQTPRAMRASLDNTLIATFEASARSRTLSMLASNRDLVNKSMPLLRKAASGSRLPSEWMTTLEERVRANATPDELRKVVSKLHADAISYFATQKAQEQSNPRSIQKNQVRSVPTRKERKMETKPSSQQLLMEGSKLAEITADGEVWIAGNKVGDITADGEIWVDGDKEGEITSDGEVWKAGDKVGDVTSEGEVWRNGEKIGSIEENGDVWLEGSNVGTVQGGELRNAAIVLFYDFYDLSN